MDPLNPPAHGEPPADPEAWTDEQWLTWLKAGDETLGQDTVEPATVASRVVRSTAGQMIGQAMLGMAQAIYGKKDDELVIIAEGDSEPHEDDPFTVRLDFEHPERSSLVFKSDEEPTA